MITPKNFLETRSNRGIVFDKATYCLIRKFLNFESNKGNFVIRWPDCNINIFSSICSETSSWIKVQITRLERMGQIWKSGTIFVFQKSVRKNWTSFFPITLYFLLFWSLVPPKSCRLFGRSYVEIDLTLNLIGLTPAENCCYHKLKS